MSYRVMVPKTEEYVDVLVVAEIPIKVTMNPSSHSVDKAFMDVLDEDLLLEVQLFEEEARKSTLYFAFMLGEKIVPEKQTSGFHIRLFADSMLPLYVGLLALTFFFFWIFGDYAPVIFVGLTFGLSLLAGRLLAIGADWKITEQQQEMQILQYKLSDKELEDFRSQYIKKIPQIRREIFDASLASNIPLSCDTANSVFTRYGIHCNKENFSIRKVNVYELVKRVADKFGLPLPKIVVSNSTVPNAAATGPGPKSGTLIITTGILTQLEDDELESVIGHELSHLKARDPLVMSTLTSAEFLLRFYVFLPFLFAFGFLSFWIYLIVAFGVIYFFGKILEGRADLDSAKVIGKPKVMAEALRKIGFRKLFPLYKREPEFRTYRIMEWLQLDPHPPTYFRIERLENLDEPQKIRNTFLRSAKDNLRGLMNA